MCVFNGLKFFAWCIGVLFTLTAISVGMSLWWKTTPFVDATNKKLEAQARLYSDAQYSAFDNTPLSGSEIYTALRQYSNESNFYLYVRTTNGGVTRDFALNPMGTSTTCQNFNFTTGQLGSGTMSCNVTEAQIKEPTTIYYVSPQARFKAQLVRDVNKRIYGIYFQMQ